MVGAPLVIALVLWPGGGLLFPGWPFALFVLALILVGLKEFYDGCRKANLSPRDGFGYAAGTLFLLLATPWFGAEHAPLGVELVLTVLVGLSLIVEALRPDRAPLKSLAPTWLGALYIGWLFPLALRLRLASPEATSRLGWALPDGWMTAAGAGALLLLFTWVITAAVDSGAYFAGKSLGRHKLAPTLSPGKTWEGSIGGFLAALLVGAGLAAWLRLPMVFALTAAALIGMIAQLGDLAKSAVKREIGVKDFGTLIPGHGGVLDRFDSLLFAAPTVFWLLVLWP